MQLLEKDTYLAMIENSIGTHLFRNNYALIDGVKTDITSDGDLSCSFFVSSLLKHFNLIDNAIAPHTRTEGLVKNMLGNGWRETNTPHKGDVVVWEDKDQKRGTFPHIGFYIDKETVISHRDTKRTPIKHHITFDGTREVIATYTHDFLT